MEETIFSRAEVLLGNESMNLIALKKVIVFGVGGVGSWCAESLIRSGIRDLTIVDSDVVTTTNLNRQLMATTKTIGQPKVMALRERLLSINPESEIKALQMTFSEDTVDSFDIGNYDYVIDAIDSLKDKALLILTACKTDAKLFSSMGAAMKLNPIQVKAAEFWKVEGDPLARTLRKRFKHEQKFPEKKFICVYSDEKLPYTGGLGSLVHITAIFGFTLAGLVVEDIVKRAVPQ